MTRRPKKLSCERLEPRAMLAWNVIEATSEFLVIGDPNDSDVGVLSYDPATDHFLLDGVDTGVAVTSSNGSPLVRAQAGTATDATFVFDVTTPFPVTGAYIPEGSPPGVRVQYDGGPNANHLRIVGGSVRVVPESRQAGTLHVSNWTANTIEYQNVRSSLHVVDAAISIDARQENGRERWVLVEAGRVWIREHFRVEGTCTDPPNCTQWIAPAVVNVTEILDLTYSNANLRGIYTGNGNDRITIDLDGMSESSLGIKTGEGDDTLLVLGSDAADTIALRPGPGSCGGLGGGGHWYDPAFPFESGACATTSLALWVTPGTTVIEYLEVEHRTVRALGGNDRIDGGPDADYLDGGSGDDLIFGRDGDDSIYGGYGTDTLYGGAGDDLLGGGDIITVTGRAGCNSPAPGPCAFQANGTSFNEDAADVLDGGAGDDMLLGTAGDNVLLGGAGNDILSGRDGNDVLNGGAGRNLILAGRGADHVLSIGFDLVATGEFYFDFSTFALQFILAEWTSPRPLAQRIANIRTGNGEGLNSEWALNETTHMADGDRDRVLSRRPVDWLLATSEDEAWSPQRRPRPRFAPIASRVRHRVHHVVRASRPD